MWEHKWDEMLKNDQNIREYFNKNAMKEPLVPRDSLFGGRTNAFVLHHTCKDNERIDYIDYTSLYPFIQ